MTEPRCHDCRVELLGGARLLAETPSIILQFAEPLPLSEVIARLAAACPALVGPVLTLDGRDLVEGYLINRNGRDFGLTASSTIKPTDRLYLLATLAGGAQVNDRSRGR